MTGLERAPELLVTGGTVVTVDDKNRVFPGGHVLARDGVIVSVGAGEPPALDPARGPREVLDASGCVVLPGFVQSHVHLCQTLFRNLADELPLLDWLKRYVWPLEAAHDEASLRASAELGIAELLLGGTTAILDMGTVRHHDVVFEAAERSGLRYVGGKAMMDAGRGVPAGLRETTAASLDESDALARRWKGAGGGRLGYAYAPRFALSCTEELLRAVADRAARGARVHTHASENRAEIAAVKRATGHDNIRFLHRVGLTGERSCFAHCVHVSPAERRLLARTGTHVAHCPSSNLKLASGIADVPALRRAGVRVSLGADGAPCNNNLDALLELRLAALLHRPAHGATALGAADVVRMATRAGAEALGLGRTVGTLARGRRCDLAIVDLERVHAGPGGDPLNRLVYSARSSDVRFTVVDGRVLVRDGVVRTLDVGRVRSVAAAQLPATLTRAGLAR